MAQPLEGVRLYAHFARSNLYVLHVYAVKAQKNCSIELRRALVLILDDINRKAVAMHHHNKLRIHTSLFILVKSHCQIFCIPNFDFLKFQMCSAIHMEVYLFSAFRISKRGVPVSVICSLFYITGYLNLNKPIYSLHWTWSFICSSIVDWKWNGIQIWSLYE